MRDDPPQPASGATFYTAFPRTDGDWEHVAFLQDMAERIAVKAGIPHPADWPWSMDTPAGIEAWAEFGAGVSKYGVNWGALKLEEMAQRPSGGPRPAAEPSSEPRLPGDLLWSEIAATYRRLSAEPAGHRWRRSLPGQPSRPEMAHALDISSPTLKRACEAAGKGTRWPPTGL